MNKDPIDWTPLTYVIMVLVPLWILVGMSVAYVYER
jgi:hypothetical protein